MLMLGTGHKLFSQSYLPINILFPGSDCKLKGFSYFEAVLKDLSGTADCRIID
jgi:hypothetical protein